MHDANLWMRPESLHHTRWLVMLPIHVDHGCWLRIRAIRMAYREKNITGTSFKARHACVSSEHLGCSRVGGVSC